MVRFDHSVIEESDILRNFIMAAIGFAVFGLDSEAFAACSSDTWVCADDIVDDPNPYLIYSHTDVCNPPPDYCPLQSVPSDDHTAAEWVTGIGQWFGSIQWSTVQVSDDLPGNVHLQPNMAGAAWPGSGNENSCGLVTANDVNYPDGSIICWGNLNEASQITGRPTGGEPYSSIAVGNLSNSSSAGTYAALTSSGNIVVWGRKGTANVFDTGKPSASGFDAVAIGYGAVGCAVDSSVAGVSCWGSDTQNIVTGAPTTGNYRAVGIGRYTAAAISTTGTMTLWGASSDATFRSNWPSISGAGVKEVFFNESGSHAGVAWLEDTNSGDGVDHDHRAVIWMDTSGGANTALIQNVPCVTGNCPATNATSFETRVNFRTAPRMTKLDQPGNICGVVESDPDGVWDFGDVICWGHMGETTNDPVLKAVCDDPTQ